MASFNSRFVEVTEGDILRMRDNEIPNNTKKATKLGMNVFRGKQCFNAQFAHLSSVFCPRGVLWVKKDRDDCWKS